MALQDAQSEARLHDETLQELGLTEQPFLEDKSRQPSADATTQKTRAALEQHVRFGDSLHLLIGEEGSGKTVLLQQLLKHCKNSIKPFVAKGSDSFRADAFLYAVLHTLNKEEQAESISEYIEVLGPMFEQITADQLAPLMIIDDAHLAPIEEIAELVDILQNFESEDGKTARLLLTGTPSLQQQIAKFEQQFEGLNLQYSTNLMQAMDEDRTREYLSTRLHQAGFADTFPFTDKAISKIQRDAGGLPGRINDSATNYLNGVYRGGAANEEKAGWFSSVEWPVMLVGAAALGAIGIGLSMFFGNKPETEVRPVVETTSIIEPAQNITQSTTDITQETMVAPTESTIQSETSSSTDLIDDAPISIAQTPEVTGAESEVAEATGDAIDTRLVIPEAEIKQQLEDTAERVAEAANDTTVPRLPGEIDTALEKSVSASSSTMAPTDDGSLAETESLSDNSLLESNNESAALGAAIDSATSGATAIANDTAADVSTLLQGDTDAAAPAPEDNTVAIQPAPVDTTPERAIENERWVLYQSPTQFTVQLATSRVRDYIIELANTMEVTDPVAIYPFLTTNSNNPVFGLLSGLYNTRAEAIAAVDAMSEETKKFGVWIRPVGDLQADINRRK